jgi:hypothetical protein
MPSHRPSICRVNIQPVSRHPKILDSGLRRNDDFRDYEQKQSLSLINKKAAFINNAAFCFSVGNSFILHMPG